MSSYIPDEIVGDILMRLPFETLTRFKSVCKSWRDLIDSSYFMETHSKRSRLNQTYPYPEFKIVALVGDCKHKQVYAFDSLVEEGQGLSNANLKQLGSPSTRFPDHDVQIVGSCNGIVCLSISKFELVLWNPFTCSYFELSSPPHEFTKLVHWVIHKAFGYDDINDDYNVLLHTSSSRDYKLCFYSLKQKSWRPIKGDFPTWWRDDDYFLRDCIIANGSAFWPYYMNQFIVSFDLGTCEFQKVFCNHFDMDEGNWTIIGFNGCLSLACYPGYHWRPAGLSYIPGVVDIWVMEKSKSWKKVASINELPEDEEIKEPRNIMPWEGTLAAMLQKGKLVAMLQKGRKLFFKDESKKLVVYDTETKSFSGETDCLGSKYFVNCVASFVNPASYS